MGMVFVWEESGIGKRNYVSTKKESQKTRKWIISYPKDVSRDVPAWKLSMWSPQLEQDNEANPLF